MALLWTRIDQKLIHGQVIVAWVPYLKINTVVVSDQDTAEDTWVQEVMRTALPPEVRALIFTTPERLSLTLATEDLNLKHILVLFKNVENFLRATVSGFKPASVNLGNQALATPGPDIRLTETFYATTSELAGLSVLCGQGLEVILQTVPSAKAIVWEPGQQQAAPKSV